MNTLNDTTGAAGVLKTGGDTWTVTGANAGNLTTGAVSFTGMGTLTDTAGGVLNAARDAWTVMGVNGGKLSNGAVSFSGMNTLNDTTGAAGVLKTAGDT